ncbi:MAG: hypothetical protein H5U40_19220 [Polyangiaceae bacterium]|nr:hypothetical protein [Polyangiaceae bacterium]
MNPPAGDYSLTAWRGLGTSAPPWDTSSGRLSLTRVASHVGAECDGDVHRVIAGTERITVIGDLDWSSATSLPAGRARMVFPFELEEDVLAEPIVAYRDPPLEGDIAYLCTGGCPEDPGATCETVDLDPVVPYVPFLIPLDAGGPLHLVIEGTPGAAGFELALALFRASGG